jgi:hypothetical protein
MNYIEIMEPIPAGANPFHYDHFNMGTYFGDERRMCAMYSDRMAYVILIDRKTGKRIKIHMGDKPTDKNVIHIPDFENPILKVDEWDPENDKVGC